MKITIIGCGWLGFPLGIDLINNGHQVFGSTRSTNKLSQLDKSGIIPFLYDGTENRTIPQSAKNCDCLILNFPPSKSENYAVQINSILEQFSTECKIIFTSSISIYKNVGGDVDENAILNENSPLFDAEQIVLYSNNKFTILRLAGLVGGERHPINHLSGKIIQDSNSVINLIHLNDIINAVNAILIFDKWNEIYNVCSSDHSTKMDYYSRIALERNLPLPEFKFSQNVGKKVKGDKIEKDLNFHYSNPV